MRDKPLPRIPLSLIPYPSSLIPYPSSPPSSQRPVVQQEEHKRQRHQHRLGRQPQGKRGHHQQVPAPRCRALDVAGIEPKRQHEKQPAQHVLALGHPGNRLDPQGMNGEDRRHPRAGPECRPSSAATPGRGGPPRRRARVRWSDDGRPASDHRAGSRACARARSAGASWRSSVR